MKKKVDINIAFSLLAIFIGAFCALFIMKINHIGPYITSQSKENLESKVKIDTQDLVINIDIDNISNLLGKNIKLKSPNYEDNITINTSNITIKDIPLGTYSLTLPSSKENIYKYPKENIIEITKEVDEITYKYEKDNKTLSKEDKISFKNEDDIYAEVYFDSNNVIVKKIATAFASSFVKIYDENNVLIKEFDFLNEEQPYEEIIPYKTGYTLSLYHVDSKALILSNNMQVKSGVNNFKLNSYGISSDDNVSYLQIVENYEQSVISLFSMEEYSNKELKENEKRIFYLSILKLDEPYKSNYLEKYSTLFKGSKPYFNVSEITLNNISDLKDNLKAYDSEDGAFTLNDNNFKIITSLNDLTKGENNLEYELFDTDGNSQKGSIKVILNENIPSILEKEENKNGDVKFEYTGGMITVAFEEEKTDSDIAYGTIVASSPVPSITKKEEKVVTEVKKEESSFIKSKYFLFPVLSISSIMGYIFIKYLKEK